MTNETFSRVLIDKELELSRWNLRDLKKVHFELSGVHGRADYVLAAERGPLAVLEGKREDVDPKRFRSEFEGACRRRLDDLFRSLLQRAFKGKL